MIAGTRLRSWVAAGAVTLLLAGVGWKAWAVQVEDGARLREQAARQQLQTVEIPAPRGAILDSRGRPLAVSADAESVWANPRAVPDVVAAAASLSGALGLDAGLLEARLAADKHFTWIARHVTPAQAAAVRALKIPGIEVTHEPRRWYPGQTSGGPVIGVADLDGKGQDGIELQMDDLLTGQRARFSAVRDARGHAVLADGLVDATPGATVQLTLDRAIQQIADQALAAAVSSHQAASGTAVVLDVATGGVLAMASVPTYDPNDPGDARHTQARNRVVTDAYEIGSVMKIFTIAAALDAGVTRPDEVWNVEGGHWHVGKKPVNDVEHDWTLTTAGIIKRSSNIGATKIGLRLGRDRLYAALKRFGFGDETGIELPGEQHGNVRNGATWREVELVTISYGYGVTVTPIQIASALAAIANGGVYHSPRLVDRVTDATGALVFERKPDTRPIMKPETAAAMIPMLASVFDGGKEGGTAHTLWVPGFACGGKTGTAHKYDPAIHAYAKNRYLSSFAGLAPIANPRIAVVVVVDDPSDGDYYGAKVAGPVFTQIASETLRYLGVPGDAPMTRPKLGPDGQPLPPKAAAAAPSAPEPEDPPPADDTPVEPIDGPAIAVPDFKDASLGKALTIARDRAIAIDVRGSGRCVGQSPPPGPAPAGTVVTLTFSDGSRSDH